MAEHHRRTENDVLPPRMSCAAIGAESHAAEILGMAVVVAVLQIALTFATQQPQMHAHEMQATRISMLHRTCTARHQV